MGLLLPKYGFVAVGIFAIFLSLTGCLDNSVTDSRYAVTVVVEEGNEPLAGVTVAYEGSKIDSGSGVTDSHGKIALVGLDGTVKIQLEKGGYDFTPQSLSVNSGGEYPIIAEMLNARASRSTLPSTSVSSTIAAQQGTGQIEDLIAVAYRELGNTNGSKYGHPRLWCGHFVSWSARQAGIDTSVIRETGIASPVSLLAPGGTYHLRTSRYTPKRGDLIFYDWGANGTIDHVGIVTHVVGGRVHTIEGNLSGSVREDSHPLNHSEIMGYGVPPYKD